MPVYKGGDFLRSVFKILIIFLIIMLAGIYTDKSKNGRKEETTPGPPPVNSGQVEPAKEMETEKIPESGAGSFIGESTEKLLTAYGPPVRKEPSAYGYDWWVYHTGNAYFLAGVENNRIVTIYATGNMDTEPFILGISSKEIFRSRYPETEIVVNANNSYYRFELSEEDLNLRPIVPIGNYYAQLYIDQFSGTLSAVRFLTKDVLLKMKPYELVYQGELPEVSSPGRSAWVHIERGNEQQIYEITNMMRSRYGLSLLKWNTGAAAAAKNHSKDMFASGYFDHESPQFGGLEDRLERANVMYHSSGENIAANYVDAAAAVEGWLNSKEHREIMLSESFSTLGTGAYRKHYTQNFTEE
ncbi:CAP domain-containing protein [Domibacillus mangrovi]|uniref:CAP domain-containing protein n=1 Tax=Domibacillus mangrovi TaxID=1714354 RepID=UPI0013565050|nr:CAP domain-containing protein [Domibacillus mangrovi]